MIDIGLSKLALIGVVALVVIGPERLPKVARMAGTLFGRAQRYINDVKTEVTREIELDELRKMQTDMQDAAHEVENSIAGGLSDTQEGINGTWQGSDSDHNWRSTPSPEAVALKARRFRQKKLARNSALPAWYKNQHGARSRVISAAARVAKFRSGGTGKPGGFF
ncbi:sec-independent protein translocase protein TatB [Herbaspirillum sp. Sphag1AN]|uniref:Sec-independent protein translocase protein TatB n=1 Tax=unclassified Herbaspirillum TaxID=2624150 RepID=UPI00161E6754|nr:MULTISPECIES: Sec-independent protein translocase protein TatB [unclassified Herbaspirillum]MBB3212660.1 sec-independent protein translocase protein TatB [Herbaspirillum sp. Sphag1AN]MBB3245857.1 sec-independent protein translocase protein TatB [Herbaspirillum sp. Sphag64]